MAYEVQGELNTERRVIVGNSELAVAGKAAICQRHDLREKARERELAFIRACQELQKKFDEQQRRLMRRMSE